MNVEAGYFGPTFERAWPETLPGLVDLYRRVWACADETIDQLPLDAPGRVPWWREGRQEVTLQRVIVHVTSDLARHARRADILREQIDTAAGLVPDRADLPDVDWPAYFAKLTALAERFPRGGPARRVRIPA